MIPTVKMQIEIDFYDGQQVNFNINTVAIEEVYKNADFITVHVPLGNINFQERN